MSQPSLRRRSACSSSMNPPMGLLGMLESRVVGRHLGLADDRRRLTVHAEAAELVVEVLLQGVADRALGVGAADVERDLVQLVGRELGAPQDEADLRSVAMADGDVPAVAGSCRRCAGRSPGRRCTGRATVSCCLSLMSELPPIATTAVPGVLKRSSWSPSAHRQRHHGLLGVKAVLGLVVDDRLGARRSPRR